MRRVHCFLDKVGVCKVFVLLIVFFTCLFFLDDYNIPIEIPLIVQTLSDQHLDIVPEFKADEISETQLIITQRTFDCERFVQRRAQHLCAESHLEFLHCEDYDIKLLYVSISFIPFTLHFLVHLISLTFYCRYAQLMATLFAKL